MTPVVQAARRYLGTPFRHRGRSASGLDCAGLVWRSYYDLGTTLPDIRWYGREPHRDGLREVVREAFGDPVHRPPIPGDVLLMRFNREPHHLAIVGDYPGSLSLIHSYGDAGRVVEHRLDPFWCGRILEIYRRDPA